MVLWEEDSFGTVQLRDLYQGVGSTDTMAAGQIKQLGQSQFACRALRAAAQKPAVWGGKYLIEVSISKLKFSADGHIRSI